ncbi:MAG: DUF917 domain-containing protein [Henriciella sp.]|nr:DUF917 domain-containing protein [Henriciella sp.]
MTTTFITPEMLADLSAGAAFLATGGGGDPHLTYLSACEGLKQFGPAKMIGPQDLSDDALVVAIGAVGAPTTSLELLPSVDESITALQAYKDLTGRTVDAVVSFEIGGGNSLIPIVAAAANDIPVIDGDGMGRALPEATMMTYAIAGIHPTPAVALDYAGNTELVEADTAEAYERLVREFSMKRGGMALTAEFQMTGAEMKACIVPETVSLSIQLGKILRSREGSAEQLAARIAQVFDASIYGEFKKLYSGIVADMSTTVIGGYDVGRAVISPLQADGPSLAIDIKNEYLTAHLGEQLLASVPDLICILDYETAQPINAERLRYGQRVSVFAIGCPDHYRTPEALKVVAPRCFGFDFDYTPLEHLP